MAKKQTTANTTPEAADPSAEPGSPLLNVVVANPLLVDPERVGVMSANVRHLATSDIGKRLLEADADRTAKASRASDEEDDDFWFPDDDWRASYRPYVVADGVLQIPVMGTLLNRFSYQFGRWATGYKYVEMALRRGMADANVRAIAFILDSPGGEVAGNFELVDLIYDFRQNGGKTIRAYAADAAYSAAYSIASAAETITVTRSGGVGSIGVISTHVSRAGALKKYGLDVTYIYKGEHKIDGAGTHKLSEQARERYQARVDKLYGVFTSTVARNREMDDKDVRETEALTYDAEESIDIGLADNVGTLEEGLLDLAEEVAEAGVMQMAGTEKNKTTESAPVVENATAEQIEAAEKKGYAAAQERFTTVLALDESKGREATALELAASNMSLDSIKGVLATVTPAKAESGKEEPKGKNHFDEKMDEDGTPGVATPEGDEQASDGDKVDAFFSDMGE